MKKFIERVVLEQSVHFGADVEKLMLANTHICKNGGLPHQKNLFQVCFLAVFRKTLTLFSDDDEITHTKLPESFESFLKAGVE